jgi:hypothetical protein
MCSKWLTIFFGTVRSFDLLFVGFSNGKLN